MIKMNVSAFVLLFMVIFLIGLIGGGFVVKDKYQFDIAILKIQIEMRDSINSRNIRIHKQDSTRIEWLFTHDRK